MGVEAGKLTRWIIERATASDDGPALLDGICRSLVEAGLPLSRLAIAAPAIDPAARSISFNWRPDRGSTFIPTAHTSDDEAVFRRSPIFALLNEDRTFGRWRLDTPQTVEDFPLLQELRAEGATDYVLHMITFAPGTALRGVAVSAATNRPSGFSEEDLAGFAEILPAVGLAVCKFSLSRTLRETLAVYLGPATSTRVLDGQIRRGEGETVSAAILLTDLRSFTALTDHDDPTQVVGWLNEHFEALGEPVASHGGEILKFLGDGFLAIFPVSEVAAIPCPGCGSALAAAELALARNRALNERRRSAGLPELAADIVLHFGPVIYGNVGTTRRLDFTVIGRAVNEASRIEKLCGELDRSLLISDSFARRCGREFDLLGTFALRGLDRRQPIWAPPPNARPAQEHR